MKLAPDRFYKGQYNFKRCANCALETIPLYSYETGKALYDVIQLEGVTYYRVNGRTWETSSTEAIHKEIVKHFKLVV